MTKPHASHQVTMYPNNSSEIHSIQIEPYVYSIDNTTSTRVKMMANDQHACGVLMFALRTIRDLQYKNNDRTGMIYDIDSGIAGSKYVIQFSMHSLYKTSIKVCDTAVETEDAKCDAKRIFRLIEKYSNVKMSEGEIEQAIDKAFASLEGNGNQFNYQSGITKFNPAPADKSDDQPRYQHDYCYMK